MAEIQSANSTKSKGVKKMTRKSTRVDLTPMVDLGFLLLTFFVFTTTLARPVVMNLVTPKDEAGAPPVTVCESCALTVIPSGENRLWYYEGMLTDSTTLQQTDYSAKGIRQLLQNKNQSLTALHDSLRQLVLIIKPAQQSSFRNFVDLTDEVTINAVPHYFLDEINEKEKQFLAQQEQGIE